MRRLVVRCSSLPAAFACPGSAQPLDVEIDPSNDAADEGSAAHALMAIIVDTDATSLDGIEFDALAQRFEVDEQDLRIQGFVGLKVWKALRTAFPNAQSEVELRADIKISDDLIVELVGHVDALALDRRRKVARQADWKWGRVDKHYTHQIKGYQFLTLANYEEMLLVDGSVCWMRGREPEIEPYTMNRDQMWEWADSLKRVMTAWDGVYHPGTQCDHCRARHRCPARREMVQADVAAFSEPDLAARIKDGLQDLPDADVVSLYRRGRSLTKVVKALDTAVRMRVRDAGGVLPDGKGRELRFVQSEKRRIDPAKAWDVLGRNLTPDELAGCLTVHASRVDDAISEKTARGQKGKEIERVTKELRAADALALEVEEKLMDVRTKGEIDG